MRSGRASRFGSGPALNCLGSLGVAESAPPPGDNCTLEGCECQKHLAELSKSFEILSDQAFTLGEFTVTPLRRR